MNVRSKLFKRAVLTAILCSSSWAHAQNPPLVYALPAAPSQKAQVQWNTPFEYPAVATRYEEEGVARMRFTVAADGSVQNLQVQRTSGYRTLDRHALFRMQSAQAQAALDVNGQPMASTVELEIVFQLEPTSESADDQRQAIDERVRRRVLRHYVEAAQRAESSVAGLAARAAAQGQNAGASSKPAPLATQPRWPAGRRVVFQAEVLPNGQMQKITLAASSGEPNLDNLAYNALLRTRSIPLAQPIDGPTMVQIELK